MAQEARNGGRSHDLLDSSAIEEVQLESRRRRRWVTALGVLTAVLLGACMCETCGAGGPLSPILLIYGFQPLPGFHPPQLWTKLGQALSGRRPSEAETIWLDASHRLYRLSAIDSMHRDVFISDYAIPYEPTVRDLRFYAARLAEELVWIGQSAPMETVDLVAFSLGALIARCYIEADDFDPVLGDPGFTDYGTVYQGDVGTLITTAAPHHGAEFAAIGPWFGPLPTQLDPASEFLAILNAGEGTEATGLSPNVRYVSLAGQSCFGYGCSIRDDVDACRGECVEEGLGWAGHDLVVLMSSARLPDAENIACIGMDHIDMRTDPAVVDAIVKLLNGIDVADVIYASPELEQAGR